MCGRYFFPLEDTLSCTKLQTKINECNIVEYAKGDIFPSNKALVLVPDKGDYALDLMTWGVKSVHHNLMINACCEGIQHKTTFKVMLPKRCLIPCNGFYEWIHKGKQKQKVYIQIRKQPMFYLAGIFNEQKEYVVVTTKAKGMIASIHDRMPIVICEDQICAYLEGTMPFEVHDFDFLLKHEENHQYQEQLSLFKEEL